VLLIDEAKVGVVAKKRFRETGIADEPRSPSQNGLNVCAVSEDLQGDCNFALFSAREKSAWKAIGCARRQLLGSQEPHQRIVHENLGHGFDATSTISAGPGIWRLLLISHYQKRLEHTGVTDEDQLFEELHTILRPIRGEELERVCEA
jgi:hypothetical protein